MWLVPHSGQTKKKSSSNGEGAIDLIARVKVKFAKLAATNGAAADYNYAVLRVAYKPALSQHQFTEDRLGTRTQYTRVFSSSVREIEKLRCSTTGCSRRLYGRVGSSDAVQPGAIAVCTGEWEAQMQYNHVFSPFKAQTQYKRVLSPFLREWEAQMLYKQGLLSSVRDNGKPERSPSVREWGAQMQYNRVLSSSVRDNGKPERSTNSILSPSVRESGELRRSTNACSRRLYGSGALRCSTTKGSRLLYGIIENPNTVPTVYSRHLYRRVGSSDAVQTRALAVCTVEWEAQMQYNRVLTSSVRDNGKSERSTNSMLSPSVQESGELRRSTNGCYRRLQGEWGAQTQYKRVLSPSVRESREFRRSTNGVGSSDAVQTRALAVCTGEWKAQMQYNRVLSSSVRDNGKPERSTNSMLSPSVRESGELRRSTKGCYRRLHGGVGSSDAVQTGALAVCTGEWGAQTQYKPVLSPSAWGSGKLRRNTNSVLSSLVRESRKLRRSTNVCSHRLYGSGKLRCCTTKGSCLLGALRCSTTKGSRLLYGIIGNPNTVPTVYSRQLYRRVGSSDAVRTRALAVCTGEVEAQAQYKRLLSPSVRGNGKLRRSTNGCYRRLHGGVGSSDAVQMEEEEITIFGRNIGHISTGDSLDISEILDGIIAVPVDVYLPPPHHQCRKSRVHFWLYPRSLSYM
ncbi:hypothetical protein J6590_005332 [Homalodisca vitripennis]|nr:hypothetical protein J6590_005332 [Homalodisca vitripennis]